MKNSNEEIKNNKSGVTLIALVVTIVVLLILAGTTIAMLTGDNGIIARAAKAKEETDKAASEEEAGLQRTLQEIASRVPSVEGYNDIKKVNSPKLAEGMIPVKWNASRNVWVVCDENDPTWYNYDSKEWANVMLRDGKYKTVDNVGEGTEIADKDLGSMYVWIPRYAYTVPKIDSNSKKIDITFVKGNTNEGVNGEIFTTDESVDTTSTKLVHPGFNFGGTALTGIWVAKFEASGTDKNGNAVGNAKEGITDYNNVLNHYYINNDIVKIENNKLKMDNTKKGSYNFILERKDTYYNKPIIFYNSQNSQNLMETGDLNPLITKVNINIDETNIIINKLDYDNSSKENSGEAKLEGAIYEILNENKEVIKEIKINENCIAEIKNLTYKKYYIREKEAGIGYQLDDNIYEFELSKKTPSIELNLTNKVIKAKIIINKVYQNENGIYNEANASFEIYNKDGKLIKTIITDENGQIEIELPYGEYTIKQTTTITGYEIVKPFNVKIDSAKEQTFKLIDYKIKVPNTGINRNTIIDLIKVLLVILWSKSL